MTAAPSPSRERYCAAFEPTSSATARSASSRSVERLPWRKKLRQRLFDFFRLVNLALLQPRPQFLDRDVNIDYFIGPLQEAVGNGLAHAHAGRTRHGVVERLEMLDVDGGEHADPRLQKVEHVFVALLVSRAGNV